MHPHSYKYYNLLYKYYNISKSEGTQTRKNITI